MRKLKYCGLLFLIVLLLTCSVIGYNQIPVHAVEVGNFSTTAKAMCVLEKDSGRVVASKDMETRLPMASTTKVLSSPPARPLRYTLGLTAGSFNVINNDFCIVIRSSSLHGRFPRE